MVEDLTEIDRDVVLKISRPALISMRLAAAQALIVLSGDGRGIQQGTSAEGGEWSAQAGAPSEPAQYASDAGALLAQGSPLGAICQASDWRLDEHARVLGATALVEAGLLAPVAQPVTVPVTNPEQCSEMVAALAGERWVSVLPVFNDGRAGSGGLGDEYGGRSARATAASWVYSGGCDWTSAGDELAALVLCGGAGTCCYVVCPPLATLLPQMAPLFHANSPVKVTHDCRRMAAALPRALLPSGLGRQTSGGQSLGDHQPVASPLMDTQAAFGALVRYAGVGTVSPTPSPLHHWAPEQPPSHSAGRHTGQSPAVAAGAPSPLCAPVLPLPPRANGEVLPLRQLLRKFLPSLCEAVLGVSEAEEAPAALPAGVLSHLPCPPATPPASPVSAVAARSTVASALAGAVQLAPLLVRLGGRLSVEAQLEDVKRMRAAAVRSRRVARAQVCGDGDRGAGGGGRADVGDASCGAVSGDVMDTSGGGGAHFPPGGGGGGAGEARLLQHHMQDASLLYWLAAANLFNPAEPPCRLLPPAPTPPPINALARAVVSNVSRHGIQLCIPCAEDSLAAEAALSSAPMSSSAATKVPAARIAREALITPAEWFGPALPPPINTSNGAVADSAASPSAAHPRASSSASSPLEPPPCSVDPGQAWPRVGEVMTVRIICSHHSAEGVSLPLASPHLQPLNPSTATVSAASAARTPVVPESPSPDLDATSLSPGTNPAAPSAGAFLWGRVYHVAPRRALVSVEDRWLARLGHADVHLRDPGDGPAAPADAATAAAARADAMDVSTADAMDASMDVSESTAPAASVTSPAAHDAVPGARVTRLDLAGVGPSAAAPRDLTKLLSPGDLIRVRPLATDGASACGDAAPRSTWRLAVAAVAIRCAPATCTHSRAGGGMIQLASRNGQHAGSCATAGRDGGGDRAHGDVGVGGNGGEGDADFGCGPDEDREAEGEAGHKRSWESDSEAEEGDGGFRGTGDAGGGTAGFGGWMGDEGDEADAEEDASLAPSKRQRAQ